MQMGMTGLVGVNNNRQLATDNRDLPIVCCQLSVANWQKGAFGIDSIDL